MSQSDESRALHIFRMQWFWGRTHDVDYNSPSMNLNYAALWCPVQYLQKYSIFDMILCWVRYNFTSKSLVFVSVSNVANPEFKPRDKCKGPMPALILIYSRVAVPNDSSDIYWRRDWQFTFTEVICPHSTALPRLERTIWESPLRLRHSWGILTGVLWHYVTTHKSLHS